jgi:hypothetical protein
VAEDTTLSRWRHGFKSRWDYAGKKTQVREPVSPVKRMKAGPLTTPDPDSTSTPATSACLEPITKMLSSLNSLGGLGVCLIAVP